LGLAFRVQGTGFRIQDYRFITGDSNGPKASKAYKASKAPKASKALRASNGLEGARVHLEEFVVLAGHGGLGAGDHARGNGLLHARVRARNRRQRLLLHVPSSTASRSELRV